MNKKMLWCLLGVLLLIGAQTVWAQCDASAPVCGQEVAPDQVKSGNSEAIRAELWNLLRKQNLTADEKQRLYSLRDELEAAKGKTAPVKTVAPCKEEKKADCVCGCHRCRKDSHNKCRFHCQGKKACKKTCKKTCKKDKACADKCKAACKEACKNGDQKCCMNDKACADKCKADMDCKK